MALQSAQSRAISAFVKHARCIQFLVAIYSIYSLFDIIFDIFAKILGPSHFHHQRRLQKSLPLLGSGTRSHVAKVILLPWKVGKKSARNGAKYGAKCWKNPSLQGHHECNLGQRRSWLVTIILPFPGSFHWAHHGLRMKGREVKASRSAALRSV